MNKNILHFIRRLIIFSIGFFIYQLIEIIFRRYTFFEMGVLGGILLCLIDCINDKISWHLDLLVQGIIGSFFVTLTELITGELCKLLNHTVMWDYSSLSFNFDGVICLYFSIIWILGIVVADVINYYVLNVGECPHYHIWKYVIYFNER